MMNIDPLHPLDHEIEELVILMNSIKGIRTTNSCFGHNKSPILIYSEADNIEALNRFRYNYIYNDSMWHIELLINDVMIDNQEWDKIYFVLTTSEKYYQYPITQLLAQNLTLRMKDKIKRRR